jgi:hypothetical protein
MRVVGFESRQVFFKSSVEAAELAALSLRRTGSRIDYNAR